MATLADIRQQYPAMADLTDDGVVDAMHQAFYSDLPRQQIADALGVKPPAPPPPPPSSLLRRTIGGDWPLAAAKAIISVPEQLTGVGDLLTGGYLGKGLEAAGVRYKDAKDILTGLESPELTAAKQKVQDAQGFLGTAGAMISNPSTIASSALESSGSLLPAGGIARGVMWGLLSAGEKAAVLALPAAEQSGAVASILGKIKTLASSGAGQGAANAGMNAEDVRQNDPQGLLSAQQSAILGAGGLATAAITGGVQGLANARGISTFSTMLATGKLGPMGGEAAINAGKSTLRRMVEGGFMEGVPQEIPMSAEEQVAKNLAMGLPWDQGVGAASAQGMMAGGFQGFIGGGFHGKHALAPTATPPVDVPPGVPGAPGAPPPLQIGNAPDPYVGFPDGTVGKRADVENYVASLPPDQQMAARAKLLGLAPQPAAPPGVPGAPGAAEAAAAAGSTDPRSLKIPETGPVSKAVNAGLDAAGDRQDAGLPPLAPGPATGPGFQPVPLGPGDGATLLGYANKRSAELDDMENGTKDQAMTGPDGTKVNVAGALPQFLTPEEKAERDFLEEHGGNAEVLNQAYPVAAIRAASAPTEATDENVHRPGDVLNGQGAPFKNKASVVRAQAALSDPASHDVVPVDGGFVLRPVANAEQPAGGIARPAPATQVAIPAPVLPDSGVAGKAPTPGIADAGPAVAAAQAKPAPAEPAARGNDAALTKPVTVLRPKKGDFPIVFDREAMMRERLANAGRTLVQDGMAQEHVNLFQQANLKEARESFDKDGKFIGKPYQVTVPGNNVYHFDSLADARAYAETRGMREGSRREMVGPTEKAVDASTTPGAVIKTEADTSRTFRVDGKTINLTPEQADRWTGASDAAVQARIAARALPQERQKAELGRIKAELATQRKAITDEAFTATPQGNQVAVRKRISVLRSLLECMA